MKKLNFKFYLKTFKRIFCAKGCLNHKDLKGHLELGLKKCGKPFISRTRRYMVSLGFRQLKEYTVN